MKLRQRNNPPQHEGKARYVNKAGFGVCIGLASIFSFIVQNADAQGSCRFLSSGETSSRFVKAFGARMAEAGAADWELYPYNPYPDPLYFSMATSGRLTVQQSEGLVQSLSVGSSELTNADFVRLQVGANFVVSRLAGKSEESTRTEVFTFIEQARSREKAQTKKIGDVLFNVQPMGKALIVIAGRHGCS